MPLLLALPQRADAATPVATSGPAATGTQVPAPMPSAAQTATPTPSPAATQAASAAPSPAASPVPIGTAHPAAVKSLAWPAMNVSADEITYDSDRYLLIARGHVGVEITGGTELRGRFFVMNLKANRYLLAGHIEIKAPHGVDLHGAAYADFLDFQRAYYLPVVNGPDRWTIVADDFAHPLHGREQPGDAFDLPEDVPGRAFMRAKKAVIVPEQEVRFDAGYLNTGPLVVPVPNYVLNLSNNPNFAQNSLVGAHFDASYPFAGSKNAGTAFHARVGQSAGIYGAVEQRIVGNTGYAVGSVAPIDKEEKQYNIRALSHTTPKLQVEMFDQLNSFQQGFSTPLNASDYLNGRVTQALKNSYLQLNLNQYYQSLLGEPPIINGCRCYQGNPEHQWIPNHQIGLDLSWIGADERVGKLPLHYRLHSGYGYAHDIFGITDPGTLTSTYPLVTPSTLVGVGVATITHHTEGFTLYTSSTRIARDHHGRDLNLNASVDDQRESFSLPHHITSTNTTVSLSKSYSTKAAAFVAYSTSQVSDNYGVQQHLAYPIGGFTGFGFSHTLSSSVILTPNTNFNLNISAQRGTDLFGNLTNSVSAELRARIRPHLTVDIQRAYYWGPGATLRFSPQFGFLLGS